MAKTRFDLCLDEVLRHEGGYGDHPSDPGGATNLGVTHKTLARWRKVNPWWKLPKTAVQQLGRSEAARIYHALYWTMCRAGDLPAGLDLAVFDFAVNSGPDRAVKALQSELGVVSDGRVGPLTLDAVRARVAKDGAAGLINTLCDRRLGFLHRLATFAVFGKGWTARVASVRRVALAAAGAPNSPISQPSNGGTTMDILRGYKSYIIALLMLLAGVAQVLGLDVAPLEGSSAGQLMLEALAVIFLRKGFKSDIGKA